MTPEENVRANLNRPYLKSRSDEKTRVNLTRPYLAPKRATIVVLELTEDHGDTRVRLLAS